SEKDDNGEFNCQDSTDHVFDFHLRRRKTPTLEYFLKHGRRDGQNRRSLPSQTSEFVTSSPRAPAKRKRDFLKRRHNSTSSLPFGVSSVPTNLSSMAECEDENDYNSYGKFNNEETNTNESRLNVCQNGELSNISNARSVHSNSCPHIELSYTMFDIVGDSFASRFPWQRDVSTQCNIWLNFKPQNLSDPLCEPPGSLSPTSQNKFDSSRSRFLSRPHSIGCVDSSLCDEEFENFKLEHARRSRNSDSFLHSNRLQKRRMTNSLIDDQGSCSDLGSISENPDIERTCPCLVGMK
ncbi:hypothetical protein KUTeg_020093, partial [Tegillarca granosa]